MARSLPYKGMAKSFGNARYAAGLVAKEIFLTRSWRQTDEDSPHADQA